MSQSQTKNNSPLLAPHGILLVDKPKGKNSFWLVAALRKRLNVKTIGHAGTLDPFATGVMVMLIGKPFTRLSSQFLCEDKEYVATAYLGVETDSYDCDGEEKSRSLLVPSLEEIQEELKHFQGEVSQVPPMFSAKKINGKKLYDLARQGKEIERKPSIVKMEVTLVEYDYPHLKLHIKCSKGTYVRSIAHELGQRLKCGAHLSDLQRTRSGKFSIEQCIDGNRLFDLPIEQSLLTDLVDFFTTEAQSHREN